MKISPHFRAAARAVWAGLAQIGLPETLHIGRHQPESGTSCPEAGKACLVLVSRPLRFQRSPNRHRTSDPAGLFLSLGGPREMRLVNPHRRETHYPTDRRHAQHLINHAEESELNVYFGLNRPRVVPFKSSDYSSRPYPRAIRNGDIARRENILIDIDTFKQGESATPEELENARPCFERVLGWVKQQNMPIRYQFCSGNGRGIVIACDLPANAETDKQVKELLLRLSKANDAYAMIDVGVHDRARITRLPGTTNWKNFSFTQSYLLENV